jgi:hypothetical protein
LIFVDLFNVLRACSVVTFAPAISPESTASKQRYLIPLVVLSKIEMS